MPVPKISPNTAQMILPLEARYNTPDKKAPNTAPVSAKGGIPIKVIRITPIMQAHSKEYHGPISTEQVILIRCAVGHIPSIRKMGEITTPIATIIARNTMRNVFILCFSTFLSSCYSGYWRPDPGKKSEKATVIPFSVEVPLLPLTPKTRIPIAI